MRKTIIFVYTLGEWGMFGKELLKNYQGIHNTLNSVFFVFVLENCAFRIILISQIMHCMNANTPHRVNTRMPQNCFNCIILALFLKNPLDSFFKKRKKFPLKNAILNIVNSKRMHLILR